MSLAAGREYLNAFPAPCRVCGGPSWRQDDEGAIHPCCALHGDNCVACRASDQLNRDQRRRARRLPIQLLDDKLSVIGEGKSLQDQEVR